MKNANLCSSSSRHSSAHLCGIVKVQAASNMAAGKRTQVCLLCAGVHVCASVSISQHTIIVGMPVCAPHHFYFWKQQNFCNYLQLHLYLWCMCIQICTFFCLFFFFCIKTFNCNLTTNYKATDCWLPPAWSHIARYCSIDKNCRRCIVFNFLRCTPPLFIQYCHVMW